jgi:Spy/CpxP family protein refolding chaperone
MSVGIFRHQLGDHSMNHLSTKWLAISCLALSGFLSSVVLAEGFGGHHGMRFAFDDPERMAEHMTRHLDLDDSQAQSVRNITEAAAPEMAALRERTRQNHDQIRALDTSQPGYDSALTNLARVSGELATEATMLHGRLRAELNAALTAEQRQRLTEKMSVRGQRWDDHRRRQK